jgi:hypothetical protein
MNGEDRVAPDWVVVETKAACEQLTQRQLSQAGYRVYLPLYRRLLIPHGLSRRPVGVMRPLFSRIVFCQDWRGWPVEVTITGAAGLMQARPGVAKISDADIALIQYRERCGEFDATTPRGNGRLIRQDLEPGDDVEFEAALGQKLVGVLEELSPNGKAIVSAILFDRVVRTTVDAAVLLKVAV